MRNDDLPAGSETSPATDEAAPDAARPIVLAQAATQGEPPPAVPSAVIRRNAAVDSGSISRSTPASIPSSITSTPASA